METGCGGTEFLPLSQFRSDGLQEVDWLCGKAPPLIEYAAETTDSCRLSGRTLSVKHCRSMRRSGIDRDHSCVVCRRWAHTHPVDTSGPSRKYRMAGLRSGSVGQQGDGWLQLLRNPCCTDVTVDRSDRLAVQKNSHFRDRMNAKEDCQFGVRR